MFPLQGWRMERMRMKLFTARLGAWQWQSLGLQEINNSHLIPVTTGKKINVNLYYSISVDSEFNNFLEIWTELTWCLSTLQLRVSRSPEVTRILVLLSFSSRKGEESSGWAVRDWGAEPVKKWEFNLICLEEGSELLTFCWSIFNHFF